MGTESWHETISTEWSYSEQCHTNAFVAKYLKLIQGRMWRFRMTLLDISVTFTRITHNICFIAHRSLLLPSPERKARYYVTNISAGEHVTLYFSDYGEGFLIKTLGFFALLSFHYKLLHSSYLIKTHFWTRLETYAVSACLMSQRQ